MCDPEASVFSNILSRVILDDRQDAISDILSRITPDEQAGCRLWHFVLNTPAPREDRQE